MAYSDRHQWTGASVDLDARAGNTDHLAFAPSDRVTIHRVGLRITSTATGTITVTFKSRNGPDATATDTTLGAITTGGSNQDGKLLYEDLATPVDMEPGDALIAVYGSDSGTSPTAYPVLVYSLSDEKVSAVTNAVAA